MKIEIYKVDNQSYTLVYSKVALLNFNDIKIDIHNKPGFVCCVETFKAFLEVNKL